MSFIDLIRELRKGNPDANKAERAMRVLGWVSLAGGIWNFVFPYIAPVKERGMPLPPLNPYTALVVAASIGTMFFLAARGIREREPWGKRMGQIAIGALLLLAATYFVLMTMSFPFPSTEGAFPVFACVALGIMVMQLGLPAYFGIRYLDRLSPREDLNNQLQYNGGPVYGSLSESTNEKITTPLGRRRYKDSPSPFGMLGTLVLTIALPIVPLLVTQRLAGSKAMGFLFAPTILFLFVGPVVFNYLPSVFEKDRRLVAAFTGGGSIFLFHASWPFFRLMVYEDAVEIRVEYHRFLIPFERMDDVPEKVGFFSRGILIKSNLPDVPSSIRFNGFGMTKITRTVHATRSGYLSGIAQG